MPRMEAVALVLCSLEFLVRTTSGTGPSTFDRRQRRCGTSHWPESDAQTVHAGRTDAQQAVQVQLGSWFHASAVVSMAWPAAYGVLPGCSCLDSVSGSDGAVCAGDGLRREEGRSGGSSVQGTSQRLFSSLTASAAKLPPLAPFLDSNSSSSWRPTRLESLEG